MIATIKKFFKPQTETLNTIFISKKAILQNISAIKNFQKNAEFFPVLKSNAYGHGIEQILEIIKNENFPYIAVDSFPEYQIVHNRSKFSVLLLGETLGENYKFFDFKRTTFAVYNAETLESIGKIWKKISIHIFLNTGMNREGVQEENLENFLATLKKFPKISVDGVMSHFHSADAENNASMHEQIKIFKKMYAQIEAAGLSPKWRHIGASCGILRMNDDFFNAFRPGVIFYGYNPLEFSIPEKTDLLSPALSVKSRIVSLQTLKPGEWVSYGQLWKTDKNSVVATLGFGYAEGFSRFLSGKLSYSREGKIFPQIGRICMNLSSCLVDDSVKIGDEITLISDDKNAENSVENIARKAETIHYEILVRLSQNIRRMIKK